MFLLFSFFPSGDFTHKRNKIHLDFDEYRVYTWQPPTKTIAAARLIGGENTILVAEGTEARILILNTDSLVVWWPVLIEPGYLDRISEATRRRGGQIYYMRTGWTYSEYHMLILKALGSRYEFVRLKRLSEDIPETDVTVYRLEEKG